MIVVVHLIVVYSLVGLACVGMTYDSRNRWGAALFVFATWWYLICVEGTPRMVPIKKFWRRG
jgi:hypothetical protein